MQVVQSSVAVAASSLALERSAGRPAVVLDSRRFTNNGVTIRPIGLNSTYI